MERVRVFLANLGHGVLDCEGLVWTRTEFLVKTFHELRGGIIVHVPERSECPLGTGVE